jgi:hypothetical protein
MSDVYVELKTAAPCKAPQKPEAGMKIYLVFYNGECDRDPVRVASTREEVKALAARFTRSDANRKRRNPIGDEDSVSSCIPCFIEVDVKGFGPMTQIHGMGG